MHNRTTIFKYSKIIKNTRLTTAGCIYCCKIITALLINQLHLKVLNTLVPRNFTKITHFRVPISRQTMTSHQPHHQPIRNSRIPYYETSKKKRPSLKYCALVRARMFIRRYSRCRNLEPSNLCAHLWCGRANGSLQQACKTKKGPPLEGTLCAENKASQLNDPPTPTLCIHCWLAAAVSQAHTRFLARITPRRGRAVNHFCRRRAG